MKIYIDAPNFPLSSLPSFIELDNAFMESTDVVVSDNIERYKDFINNRNNTFIYYCENNSLEKLISIKDMNINHIIGKSEHQINELIHILQKLHFKNFYGIEKYLNEDAIIFSEEIIHSKDVSEKIEEIIGKLNYDDTFDSPKDNLRVVLNELATNAFFHQEDIIDSNRKNSIFTTSNNSVIIKAAKDSSSIIVYVKDNIGTIRKDLLIQSIKRGFEEKTPKAGSGGAGLGLYMVFENINQLHINKKNDKFCEFIGIIEVSKRYKKFKERVTSFHFFEEL